MNFSIPYWKHRRYLTGIDWILGALHHAGKKVNGIGAVSQAVLELEGSLSEAKLRSAADDVSKRFPLIHGKYGRDFLNLAPYWRVPGSAKSARIPLKVVDLPADADAQAEQVLADHLATPFESERQHVRLLLVRLGTTRSKLGLMFDHRLFDAFGAEAFYRLLDEASKDQLDPIVARVKTTEPAHLDNWMRRFASGQTLNRLMYRLAENDIVALAPPQAPLPKRIRFVHEALTVEETARVNRKAFEELSVPILLPSAVARSVAAMHHAIPNPPLTGPQYIVFTTTNSRSAGQEWETLFFNRFSLLMLSVPCDPIKPVSELAVGVRDQLFGLIKDQIPAKMEECSALGRIFPRSLLANYMNSSFNGRLCSIYLACIKETGFPGETFLGLPAKNLFHTPLAFGPPGVNLCMTFFANRFNLVISYLEGVLDEDAARRIMREFKRLLVEG